MANEYSLIFFRKGTGVWWNNTDKPSGATGFTHGKMTYGTSGTPNYLVSGGVNTFNQGDLSSGKAEPWVNTSTNQLFVGNVCINPEVKVKLHGTIVNPTLTFDENYKVQSIIDISEQDQYLETVSNLAIPTTSAGASTITSWVQGLLGGSGYTATLSSGVWTVSGGNLQNDVTFDAGSNEICFVWNLSNGVQTPTFMEIPDTNTDTTYDLIVGSSASTITNTTSALTNGNVFLNLIDTSASPNTVVDHHSITGTNLIEVVTDSSANIIIKHAVPGDSSTDTEIEATLTGAILNIPTISYDEFGHITGTDDNYITLPTGGGSAGGSHTFYVGDEVTDATATKASTPRDLQGVLSETHKEQDSSTGYTGTSGQTIITKPSGVTIASGDTLTVNAATYTVSSVAGNTVTLSTALASDVTSDMTVEHVYTTTESPILIVQQSGITASNNNANIGGYDGTKVTFKRAASNADTASNADYLKTLLISIEVIDGGVFD